MRHKSHLHTITGYGVMAEKLLMLKGTGVETDIFDSQIPGGMISHMESQLKQ